MGRKYRITEENVCQDPDKACLIMATILHRDELQLVLRMWNQASHHQHAAKVSAILRGQEK